MKTKVFWSEAKIRKYYEQNFNQTKTHYAIISRVRVFGFWTRFQVLFHSQTDIQKEIRTIVTKLLEEKLTIKVNRIRCGFLSFSNYEIDVDLFTTNNNLIVGKFGQNQKSLELLISLSLSNIFRTRYKINLNFPNYHKNFRRNPNTRRLSQKKPSRKPKQKKRQSS